MYLRFDLKKPCKDCPFKKTTEKHEGIAGSLIKYHGFMELGTFAHTCHKTDARADSEEGKKHKGPVQHCAGALALMKKDPGIMSTYVADLIIEKKLDLDKIDHSNVYESFIDMAKDYFNWLKKRANKKTEEVTNDNTYNERNNALNEKRREQSQK